MTNVFSVTSRDTLWVVADRRLSYGKGRKPRDDGMKILALETDDGVGVLAYAGLGATPRGTHPSHWMSTVLRGRCGLTFEQSLSVLMAAANRELPRYLTALPGGEHVIIAPAFIKGIGARLYSIENRPGPEKGQRWYRGANWQRSDVSTSPSVRIAGAGSGSGWIPRNKDAAWHRALRSLVREHDRGKISDLGIADQLAVLNYEVHQALPGSVGPQCIVVWRRRPDARPRPPGGGHQFYTGLNRDQDSPLIPRISSGLDLQAMGAIFLEEFRRVVTQPDFDFHTSDLGMDEITRRIVALPDAPEEKLR